MKIYIYWSTRFSSFLNYRLICFTWLDLEKYCQKISYQCLLILSSEDFRVTPRRLQDIMDFINHIVVGEDWRDNARARNNKYTDSDTKFTILLLPLRPYTVNKWTKTLTFRLNKKKPIWSRGDISMKISNAKNIKKI